MTVKSPWHKSGHDKESANQRSSKQDGRRKARAFYPIKCLKRSTDTAQPQSRQGYSTDKPITLRTRKESQSQFQGDTTSRLGTHIAMDVSQSYEIWSNATCITYKHSRYTRCFYSKALPADSHQLIQFITATLI